MGAHGDGDPGGTEEAALAFLTSTLCRPQPWTSAMLPDRIRPGVLAARLSAAGLPRVVAAKLNGARPRCWNTGAAVRAVLPLGENDP